MLKEEMEAEAGEIGRLCYAGNIHFVNQLD